MAMAMRDLLDTRPDTVEPAVPPSRAPVTVTTAEPVAVKHYAVDDSVFVGNDYLIKGVAGAILAKLVREHLATQRVDFTNRELRLDASIALPDLSDNLEARLVLLQRRLASRAAPLQIEKTGRGRFRLIVQHPVTLVEMPNPR
jgi:hypothetical protein